MAHYTSIINLCFLGPPPNSYFNERKITAIENPENVIQQAESSLQIPPETVEVYVDINGHKFLLGKFDLEVKQGKLVATLKLQLRGSIVPEMLPLWESYVENLWSHKFQLAAVLNGKKHTLTPILDIQFVDEQANPH